MALHAPAAGAPLASREDRRGPAPVLLDQGDRWRCLLIGAPPSR